MRRISMRHFNIHNQMCCFVMLGLFSSQKQGCLKQQATGNKEHLSKHLIQRMKKVTDHSRIQFVPV